MQWVKDRTGRFPERPHYDPAELDAECERIVEGFLKNRHGDIQYPISTDDLILMLEKETESVDQYVDFEEKDVWGETIFPPSPGVRPKVKISKSLSLNDR